MLARAARSAEPAPALALGTRLWAATALKDVRGAACPWRGLGVVGRGEQIFAWERRRSAPRTITVPNELTKECLWAGARRLTDRAQAAGDSPASAREVDDSPCLPGHNAPIPFERSPPVSFKRLLDSDRREIALKEHDQASWRMPTHRMALHLLYRARDEPLPAAPDARGNGVDPSTLAGHLGPARGTRPGRPSEYYRKGDAAPPRSVFHRWREPPSRELKSAAADD